MSLDLYTRARGRYVRTAARLFFRRPFPVRAEVPYISFTFDDFPRSALSTGGAILKRYGFRGTYYTSFGLMGTEAPTGTMFLREDLEQLVAEGHEAGCHTFGHCHASQTRSGAFEKSIIENREVLAKLAPGVSFRTLSYPISQPRATTKRKVARHFDCCRGGGQVFNSGSADLNCLAGYFLEQSRDYPQAIKDMIDQNRRAKGWLIFATHDVCDSPTPWGCTPALFEDIVACSAASGARILTVAQAWDALRGRP